MACGRAVIISLAQNAKELHSPSADLWIPLTKCSQLSDLAREIPVASKRKTGPSFRLVEHSKADVRRVGAKRMHRTGCLCFSMREARFRVIAENYRQQREFASSASRFCWPRLNLILLEVEVIIIRNLSLKCNFEADMKESNTEVLLIHNLQQNNQINL